MPPLPPLLPIVPPGALPTVPETVPTTVHVLAAASTAGFSWWVLVPTLVMLSVAAAAAPLWPWSRRWGWEPAGIFGVAAGTAALFTTAWWLS